MDELNPHIFTSHYLRLYMDSLPRTVIENFMWLTFGVGIIGLCYHRAGQILEQPGLWFTEDFMICKFPIKFTITCTIRTCVHVVLIY